MGLKTVRESDKRLFNGWVCENENACVASVSSFLNRTWKEAVDIAQSGGAVVLTSKKTRHAGTVISADLLQKYYDAMDYLSDYNYDALDRYQKKELKEELPLIFDPSYNMGHNILVVDKDDVPIVAIVNPLFSSALKIDEDGVACFREDFLAEKNISEEEAEEILKKVEMDVLGLG